MDMVRRNVAFLNVHIERLTGLANQFAQAFSHLTPQDWFAVFRDPHDVIFQVVDGMRSLSIGHIAILTQDQRGVKTACLKAGVFTLFTDNKLAHEGSFPSDRTPAEHYQRMQHFLDRVMLRLFDYHGPYYDFEHSEFRQI